MTCCSNQTSEYQFPASPLYDPPFNESHTLRFFLSPGSLSNLLVPYIIDRGVYYGTAKVERLEESNPSSRRVEKLVVEFSSPNLGQEFSFDHLRSTTIGKFIASIFESMGWDVVKINFLGDWGKHIGLLAVGWAKFYSDKLYAEDPLRHLIDLHTKAEDLLKSEHGAVEEGATTDPVQGQLKPIDTQRDEFFRSMENGEPDAMALWNKLRDPCICQYAELYARLGIEFEEYSGESKFTSETASEVDRLLNDEILKREEDGAWIIQFETYGYKSLGSPKLRYPDGTTTYLFRDIAAVLERDKQYSFDRMIYVVSGKQDLHFNQLIGALTLMGHADLASKLQHISFGKVQGLVPETGGRGILLDHILDRCQQEFSAFLEKQHDGLDVSTGSDVWKMADSLACIGLMTQQGLIRRGAIYNFDLDDMASLSPYNGLVLQFWLSKIRFQKLKDITIPQEALVQADYSFFDHADHEAFADVLRLLVQFPGVVKQSFRTLESSHILMLLFRVTDLLPDVWAADSDNQQQRKQDGKEEAGNSGPSNTNGVEAADHTEPIDLNQVLDHDDNEPIRSGGFPDAQRSERDSQLATGLAGTAQEKVAAEDGLTFEESHREEDEGSPTQITAPAKKESLEDSSEAVLANKGGHTLGEDKGVLEFLVQDPFASTEEDSSASIIEQSGAFGEATRSFEGRDGIPGKEEQPLAEALNDGDSNPQTPTSEGPETKHSRDSGIFLGGAEVVDKAPIIAGAAYDACVSESDKLEPRVMMNEEKETGKDTESLVEDRTLGEKAESAPGEDFSTSGPENREKGKGKELPNPVVAQPHMSPERLVKLAFYECVRQVLENGMRMVGMVPLKV